MSSASSVNETDPKEPRSMTLQELIDAIENATCADRDLDCWIAYHLGLNWKNEKYSGGDFSVDFRDHMERFGHEGSNAHTNHVYSSGYDKYVEDYGGSTVEPYTRSVDSAIKTRPDGFLWSYCSTRFVPHAATVYLPQTGGYDGNSDYSAALAICAAGLKARLGNATQLNQEKQP